MDDNDFIQVADFIQVFTRGPIQQYEQSCLLRNLKKFSRTFLQMFGLTATLVASNLITVKFTPAITTLHQEPKFEICFANNASIDNDGFRNEFGCYKNVCWRSCYSTEENQTNFWCYTSPILNSLEYKKCTHHTDCAPHWECLDPCHGKTNLFIIEN